MKSCAAIIASAVRRARIGPLGPRPRTGAILSLALAAWAPCEVGAQAIPRSPAEAGQHATSIEALLEKAKQGQAQAQYDLAAYFASGKSGQPSTAEAVHWLRQAAGQGHAQAQSDLGRLYHGGFGVPKDASQAAKWLQRAAEQGHAPSQADLGRLYYLGDGVKRDAARAAEWYGKAARQGIATAQFNLAGLHATGDGIPKDAAEAASWYRAAAEQGLAEAQHAFAVALIRGNGIHEDLVAAADWLRKAAGQGLPEAQFLLARQHETGAGVARDFDEAVGLYKLASEQGLVEAQRSLGRLYWDGPSGIADPVRGQMWLIVAARNAPKGSRETIASERDEAARNLTAEQAADAERLAGRWTRRTWAEIQDSSPTKLTAAVHSTGLTEFFRSAGQRIAEAQVEYDKYWRPHIERSRLGILEAAHLVREPGTALVLGAGACREIPLEELAEMFNRVVLVDLDSPSMSAAVARIPRHLRNKIEIRVSDVTSFAKPLMDATAHIMGNARTASDAFIQLRSLYGAINAIERPPSLPQADLVVSSLVLSELARYPSTYAARLFSERFNANLSEWRGSGALWRTLREFSSSDHASMLARLVRPGSVVYFADTVGRGPDLRWVDSKEKRTALRVIAEELAQLGVFQEIRNRREAWEFLQSAFRNLESVASGFEPRQSGVAETNLESLVAAIEGAPGHPPAEADRVANATTQLLCQDRLPVDIEISAYEAVLDSYESVEPRTLERLLDWDGFLGALRSLRLEPIGAARSWKWLEYACQIPRGSGGFTVRSVILRNLGK